MKSLFAITDDSSLILLGMQNKKHDFWKPIIDNVSDLKCKFLKCNCNKKKERKIPNRWNFTAN